RVTPLSTLSSPFLSRLTHKGGMPVIDLPYWFTWRQNFKGSAPCNRLDGNRRVRGSTCRNSPATSRRPYRSVHRLAPAHVTLPRYQPTLPSRLTPSSFCASTANSIGRLRNTCLQKPLTIMFTASSVESPRCLQ